MALCGSIWSDTLAHTWLCANIHNQIICKPVYMLIIHNLLYVYQGVNHFHEMNLKLVKVLYNIQFLHMALAIKNINWLGFCYNVSVLDKLTSLNFVIYQQAGFYK